MTEKFGKGCRQFDREYERNYEQAVLFHKKSLPADGVAMIRDEALS
jgi:hypothetical protein